jgi:hypothetical protein
MNKKLKNTNLEYLLHFVNQEGDKKEFDLCIEYLNELDKMRDTDWTTVFPELYEVVL